MANSQRVWECWLIRSAIGFGKRSWSYFMLVEDGVITKMFIEDEVPETLSRFLMQIQ